MLCTFADELSQLEDDDWRKDDNPGEGDPGGFGDEEDRQESSQC